MPEYAVVQPTGLTFSEIRTDLSTYQKWLKKLLFGVQ